MKKIYISHCTEYELGWDNRPDGFIISEDKEAMIEFINTSGNCGSPEYFWRYNEPTEVFCETKTYKKIVEKMRDNDIAHYNNGDDKKLELYKKL